MSICPCESALSYTECCQPLHEGRCFAITAEQLMRSRYSAFFKKLPQYLVDTHHPDYRHANEIQILRDGMSRTQWIALSVIKTYKGTQSDLNGIVEFKASCIENETPHMLHSSSNFVRENERWFYTDDRFRDFQPLTPGRNEPCWCKSGKKYKFCHGQ